MEQTRLVTTRKAYAPTRSHGAYGGFKYKSGKPSGRAYENGEYKPCRR
ncbi:MAG: hypothetical protein WCQ72_07285 [Eubacteriales bacterium]